MLCHEVVDDPWRGIRGDAHILQRKEHTHVLSKNNNQGNRAAPPQFLLSQQKARVFP